MITPGDVVRAPDRVGTVRAVSSYGVWLFLSGRRYDHAEVTLVGKRNCQCEPCLISAKII